jgi:hypothetical protein
MPVEASPLPIHAEPSLAKPLRGVARQATAKHSVAALCFAAALRSHAVPSLAVAEESLAEHRSAAA